MTSDALAHHTHRLAARGRRFLEAICRATGLTPDRAGLVRLCVYLLVLYGVYTTYPDRPQRGLRYAYDWLGVAAFLLLFGRGWQQLRGLSARGERPTRILWIGFALFAAVALFIPAWHSADIHAYVNIGWLQTEYGVNPYVTVPAELPGWQDDPMLYGVWREVPCTYGFLYPQVCRAMAELGGGDPWTTRLLFRVFGVLVIVLCALLVRSTLRRLDREAESDRALYLFLWNPYVVLHFVANAHNDLLMALFLLVGFRLALSGRRLWVIPALAAAMLIKHVALVAIPFAFVFLVKRHGWLPALAGSAAGLLLVALVSWPYASDWSEFRWSEILGILAKPRCSFQAAVGTMYQWVGLVAPALAPTVDGFREVVRLAFGFAFLLFAVHRFVRATRQANYDARHVVEDSLLTLFVLLCVFSPWLPWYLGMFLPAVFLLPAGHWVRRLTIWITCFQMLSFTGIGKAQVLEAVVTLGLPMLLYWRLARRPPEVHTEEGPA